MNPNPTSHGKCPCGNPHHWTIQRLKSNLKPMNAYPWDHTLLGARRSFDWAPSSRAKALELREFLNSWTCRIALNDESTELFVQSFTEWFNKVEGLLNSFPPIGQLTDEQIEQLADIYWDLARRPAAVRRDGVLRTFGPTAAAKAMMFFFGETCPAWDAQIRRRRTNGFGDRASYVRYLKWARSQAQCLEAQHAALPDAPGTVADYLRGKDASLAFIIDTAGYLAW